MYTAEPTATNQGSFELDSNSTWYRFSTRTCMSYFIEVPWWSGLMDAIEVLKETFGINAVICESDEGPVVNKIEVVTDSIPEADNRVVFVGRSKWFDCM